MDNSDSLEYLNQARSFADAERYDDALEYIEKAISADRMNKEFYIEKCIILANMNRYDDAIASLQNALKIDKTYADAYFHMANMCLMKGDKSSGILNYNKAIANGYDDAQIYFNLGLMYEEDGNLELALRNYTKAILKDPLRSDARVRKAGIFIAAGKRQEALETVNELILADPDLFDGYHLKSKLLADMGKEEEAMAVLEEAVKLFPKDPAFLLDKINLLVEGKKPEEAEKLAKEIESSYELENSQKRQLELEKARLYALKADINSIIDCLQKARAYTRKDDETAIDGEATFLLVNCYLEKNDFKAAADCARELIGSDNLAYAIPAYYMLPYAYSQMGEKDKAEALYKESISRLRKITLDQPELLDGYLFRALCLKDIGKYEKAMELSDYLLKMDDKRKEFHNLKAEVLYAMGKKDEAQAEKALAASLK